MGFCFYYCFDFADLAGAGFAWAAAYFFACFAVAHAVASADFVDFIPRII